MGLFLGQTTGEERKRIFKKTIDQLFESGSKSRFPSPHEYITDSWQMWETFRQNSYQKLQKVLYFRKYSVCQNPSGEKGLDRSSGREKKVLGKAID